MEPEWATEARCSGEFISKTVTIHPTSQIWLLTSNYPQGEFLSCRLLWFAFCWKRTQLAPIGSNRAWGTLITRLSTTQFGSGEASKTKKTPCMNNVIIKSGFLDIPPPLLAALISPNIVDISKEPSKQNLLTYQRPLNVICTQPPYNYCDQWEIF